MTAAKVLQLSLWGFGTFPMWKATHGLESAAEMALRRRLDNARL